MRLGWNDVRIEEAHPKEPLMLSVLRSYSGMALTIARATSCLVYLLICSNWCFKPLSTEKIRAHGS